MNDSKKKPADVATDEQQIATEPAQQAPVEELAVSDPAPVATVTMTERDPFGLAVDPELSAPQTCAACGETDVFTEHSTIDETTLDYHSCPEAAALVHDYAVKSIRDRDYPKPVLAS